MVDKHKAFGAGSILRQRFRLLSTLGEGGMSTVWKALDLLKEEARDPNPYVAVKLLSDDFQEHPEAFIALQRESSKAMRLAHPNIATVYDFDRDGHTIYMTMEVLEGQDLTTFIRHLPAEGLPVEKAMSLIKQLSAGLSYAHAAKLVHSDLKPGNAFLTREGVVKLLDFGIARASKAHGDDDGEITLFDPGKLGALTPTYATLEMFEGLDPDPRDDIYALAIISYQLFTGRHPYGKQSAPKALKQKLSPPPVLHLSRRQNRGLLRALALHRADRTATVDEFLQEIRPHKNYARQMIAASMAGLLLTAGLAYKPLTSFNKAGKQEAVITLLQRGDAQGIRSGLEQLNAFDNAEQQRLRQDARGRTALITYYLKLKDKALETYDYPAAEKALEDLTALYPDSARVFQSRNALRNRKTALLNALNEQYKLHIKQGDLLSVNEQEDIHDVLRIVAQADPGSPLLKDRRLALRYEALIRAAMKAHKAERVKALLISIATYLPNDTALNQLRVEVEKKLKQQRDMLLLTGIRQRIGKHKAHLKSLGDFQQIRNDLVQLVELAPNDRLLRKLQGRLNTVFRRAVENNIRSQRWESSESLLFQFAPLLNLSELLKRREHLSMAEAEIGIQPVMNPTHVQAVAQRQNALQKLFAQTPVPANWENMLSAPFKELIALLPAADPRLKPIVAKIAERYIEQAQNSRGANRFAEALVFLKRGQKSFPATSTSHVPVEPIGADQKVLLQPGQG